MNCVYFNFVLLLILSVVICLGNCDDDSNLKCLDSSSHKPHATPVEDLYGECRKWKSLSCCEMKTTQTFHLVENWKGFNYNHCGAISDECKNYFLKELCFYECDPYLGNWIVQDRSKKMRNERYYQIPLCYSDCSNWYNACKYDYTCRDNWNRGFKWINNTNYCNQEKCETIENKFRSAENFCTQIWDEAFSVEENNTNCLSFEFKEDEENPNKRVAQFYSQLNGALSLRNNVFLLIALSFLAFIF